MIGKERWSSHLSIGLAFYHRWIDIIMGWTWTDPFRMLTPSFFADSVFWNTYENPFIERTVISYFPGPGVLYTLAGLLRSPMPMLIDLYFWLYGSYGLYFPGPGVQSLKYFSNIALGTEKEGLSCFWGITYESGPGEAVVVCKFLMDLPMTGPFYRC